MVDKQRQPAQERESRLVLLAQVDQRAIPALDRVASTNEVSTGQLMSEFFGDISDAVEFLSQAEGGSFTTVEEWFARLILHRCRGTTPEALRAVGRIWERAAELKAQEGGAKG